MSKKKIPRAVICDPPEPTTIDESDLAEGMVAFVCREGGGMRIVSTDARLYAEDTIAARTMTKWFCVDDEIRRVAARWRLICPDYVPIVMVKEKR